MRMLMLIAMMVPLSAAVTSDDLKNGLISMWHFDGNCRDALAEHHGTESGAVSYAAGVYGKAAVLGDKGHITLPDAPFKLKRSFTMAGWVKASSFDGFPGIFGKGYEPRVGSYSLHFRGDGHLWFEIIAGDGTRAVYEPSDSKVDLGEWAHVAATYDGAMMRLYIDGREVGKGKPLSADLKDTAEPLRIGWLGQQGYLSGAFDEVVCYGRSLPQEEIAALMRWDENGIIGEKVQKKIQPLVRDLKVQKIGTFKIAGVIECTAGHFAPGWVASMQAKAFTPSRVVTFADGAWNGNGKYALRSGAFNFEQSIREIDADTVSIEYSVTSDTPVPTTEMFMSMTFPAGEFAGRTFLINGEKFALPLTFGRSVLYAKETHHVLVIDTDSGTYTVEGDFNLRFQDDREYGVSAFGIRLGFTPRAGDITAASLKFTLKRKLVVGMRPIDISKAANMAFRDETADDKKGGWTDQGPDNDLRSIPSGELVSGNLSFSILDPAKNSATCIVLAGPSRGYFPGEAAVTVDGEPFSHLYLLHASAWTPKEGIIGTIRVSYADGSTQDIPVAVKHDVDNWWGPSRLSNGFVIWSQENRSAFVGLYASKFRIEQKPVKTVTLKSTGKAVWMIAAMSAGDDVPFPSVSAEYIIANDQWRAYDFTTIYTEPKSILDFSAAVESGPAGKHGAVVIRSGKYEFEKRPGKPVRFLGGNLCFYGNFLEKKIIDDVAANYVRMGYNSVRLHHYDSMLVTPPGGKAQEQFLPEMIDALDYVFASLKKNGIYISIDLYTTRAIPRSAIPEYGREITADEFKGLIPLFDSAFNEWARFSEQLLKHVNPHTGLAWKDDPALYSICLVNEDTIGAMASRTPAMKALYDARFEQWLKNNPSSDRSAAYNRFLMELALAANKRMTDHLRGIGVKAFFTGANFHPGVNYAWVRDGAYDYVDMHTYWDHPSFPSGDWALPMAFHQRSGVAAMAQTPRDVMASRMFGKPFSVSEYCYTWPNHYRAEGGALMGAYAALQDWDALYRFEYTPSKAGFAVDSTAVIFRVTRDPISMLSERFLSMLFLRGDVAPAKGAAVFAVTGSQKGNMSYFPGDFSRVGLAARIGHVLYPEKASIVPAPLFVAGNDDTLPGVTYYKCDGNVEKHMPGVNADALSAVSDTGELSLDGTAKTFKVVTPRSEGFVIYDKGTLSGSSVKVVNDGGFASVYVSAMDGKAVNESARMAVMHLTDVMPTKARFKDPQHLTLDQWGEFPLLVRAGSAVVKIRTARDGVPKVFAVDITGKRKAEMEVSSGSGFFAFTAATHQKSGIYLAYEVSFE